MKNLFKNAVVFIVLSVVLSGFFACSKNNPTTEKSAGDVAVASAKNDYPPAPTAIMQSEIKDVDGNAFKLDEQKGKVVLVNLWATWCGPCRAEMPELIALQDKHRDKNFEIIGLDSDDESVEEIKSFADKMKLNYRLGYADSKLMREFLSVSKFDGIPQSFLIDREGRLRNVFVGGGPKIVSQLKEAVEKAVGE